MSKSPDAFRTIGEVAELLDVPAHVLRFWETRFTQIRPVKRAGGRRYYRPTDVALLAGIRKLLHEQGMTIRGVQKLLRDEGVRHICALADQDLAGDAAAELAQDVTILAPVAQPVRVIPWPGRRESAAADPDDDLVAVLAGPGADDAAPQDPVLPTGSEAIHSPDVAAGSGAVAPPRDAIAVPAPDAAGGAGLAKVSETTAAPPVPAPLDDLPLFGGLRDPDPAPPPVVAADLTPAAATLAPRVLVARLLLSPVGAIPPDRGARVLAGLRALRRQMSAGRSGPAG